MIKTASRLALIVATASLAVAPVAAQANTRAGDNGTVYGAEASTAGAIFGAVYDDEEKIAGAWVEIIGGILAASLVLVLLSGGSGTDRAPNQSRGA
ncbi:hypothetical protein [Erythrobacter sp. F6033]|uniref:hypothetical protein n=1 Tax=Erythrobacter sp. F6033 TaxID=2926401 RepID=UPI001FF4F6E1|nr:hypothetical protein [Erythrobacter sp. F6033]MCK0127177.1 hypothetical protein [Erythrobacter sp. F6033]